MTVFVLASVLARPFVGGWMERVGKKRLALIALTFLFVFSALYFLVDNDWLLLVLRFAHGASFGIATSCTGTIPAGGVGYHNMYLICSVVMLCVAVLYYLFHHKKQAMLKEGMNRSKQVIS